MNSVREIERRLPALTAAEKFSGAVVVRQDGEDVYAKAFGFASLRWKVPNTLATIFPNASVTKMFTAVAVLQLAEQQAFTLATAVTEYLGLHGTSIPPDVRVSHLLTHTSGIGDYFDNDSEEAYEQVWATVPNYSVTKLSDMLPLFVDKPPTFKAGERFSYCDAGFILLGLIVERASGRSYFDYVRDHVLAPAQMGSAGFVCLDSVRGAAAEGHVPIRDGSGAITGWRLNVYSVPVRGASDGGAAATAHDHARFLASLREGALLPADAVQAMVSPRVEVEKERGQTWAYGYGTWILLGADGRVVCYGHAGEDPGVSARVFHYPRSGIDAVVLGNLSGCAGPIDVELRRIIAGGRRAQRARP